MSDRMHTKMLLQLTAHPSKLPRLITQLYMWKVLMWEMMTRSLLKMTLNCLSVRTWLILRYERMHTKLFLNLTAHASKVLRPIIEFWMWKMPMWTKSRQCTLLYQICKHTVDMRKTSWGYLFHLERTAKRKNKGSWYFPELTSNVWLKHLYWTFLIYVCPRLSSILVFLFSHCIESNSQNSYCDPMSEWLWQAVLELFKLKILNGCDRIFYGKEMCSVRAEVTWYQPHTMSEVSARGQMIAVKKLYLKD